MAPGKEIDPVAQFMQEHDHTLQQLASLNRAVHSLVEQGYSASGFKRVEVGLDFIHQELGEHNTREEEALFPVLERYVEGPTDVMRREHRLLRRRYIRLRRAADKVSTRPSSKSAILELSLASASVVQLLVNHIHKENQILLPLVRKFLTKDALREVARRMV
jgi:hemerythrin-like domain-containing protein